MTEDRTKKRRRSHERRPSRNASIDETDILTPDSPFDSKEDEFVGGEPKKPNDE